MENYVVESVNYLQCAEVNLSKDGEEVFLIVFLNPMNRKVYDSSFNLLGNKLTQDILDQIKAQKTNYADAAIPSSIIQKMAKSREKHAGKAIDKDFYGEN